MHFRAILLACLLPAVAWAQQSPNFKTGQTPSASQWNAAFSAKTDVTNGTLNNPQISGGNIQNAGISGTITGNATWTGVQTFTGTLGFTNLLATGTSALNGSTTIGTSSAAANTIMNGPTASNRTFFWQTAGVNRWRMLTDSTAESGSDAGSRWNLCAQHDAGTNNFCSLTIDRRYGAWAYNTANTVTFSGSDPGTQLFTRPLQFNEFISGTTTGAPVQYNLFWVRRDDVNMPNSQGIAWDFVLDTACTGPSTCAPDLSFNGTIVGNVLTINSVTSGTAVAVGDFISGTGVVPVHIASFGTGTGTTGTYNLDNSLNGTVGPEAMTSVTPNVTVGRASFATAMNVAGPLAPNGRANYSTGIISLSGSGDGGGTAAEQGAGLQGFDCNIGTQAGATNWDNELCAQFNISATSGNNFGQRNQLIFGTGADNGTQGAQQDTFLAFGVTPYLGLTNPPFFGMQHQSLFYLGGAAAFPLDANNGELLHPEHYFASQSTPRPPMQAWRGFTLAPIQFSDYALSWGGSRLTGTGGANIQRLAITGSANGPVLDATTLAVASISSVAANVGVVKAGEQFTSRLGGIIIIDTVNGSSHVTAAHYLAGSAPTHASSETIEVASSFVTNPSASGQPVLSLRNGTMNVAPGDGVTAVGPSAACNSGIPGGTTVNAYNAGTGNFQPTVTLSANLTANMTYGCEIIFTRPGNDTTDSVVVGQTVMAVFNIAWTLAPQMQLNASSLLLGSGTELNTAATTGFTKIQTTNGLPTGNCGGAAGAACIVVDRANKKFCWNVGGGWECSGAFLP